MRSKSSIALFDHPRSRRKSRNDSAPNSVTSRSHASLGGRAGELCSHVGNDLAPECVDAGGALAHRERRRDERGVAADFAQPESLTCHHDVGARVRRNERQEAQSESTTVANGQLVRARDAHGAELGV